MPRACYLRLFRLCGRRQASGFAQEEANASRPKAEAAKKRELAMEPEAKAVKDNSVAQEVSMPARVRLEIRRRSDPAAFQGKLGETVILRDNEVVAVLPEGDPLRYA
jgi:hypothetical protein